MRFLTAAIILSVSEGKDKMLARVKLDAAAEREELKKEIARIQKAAKHQADEDAAIRDNLAQELETACRNRLVLEGAIGDLEAKSGELAQALAHEQRSVTDQP